MEKVEFEKQLLEAIKKDDLKSFTFLMPTNADLNLCYGRFPILSLLYLYSSFKILAKYEKYLMPIHNFKKTYEPIEIYKTFKTRAKKTLRFFEGEEIVYPILMLGVLNEKMILENNYKFLYKNAEICELLSKIYILNHKLSIIQDSEKIAIQSKKLTKSNFLWTGLLSLVMCFMVTISCLSMVFVKRTSGLGTLNNPIQIATAAEFKKALKTGKRYYNLNDDIELTVDFSVNEFSGTIYGNGHKVKLLGDFSSALIKNLSGNLTDLKFYLTENKIKITQNSAIISEKHSGNIENCEIIGNFDLEFMGDEGLYFGLFSSSNSGRISNCSVSVSAGLVNGKQSDAYFGGLVGINEEKGEIENCATDGGVIQADTVDLSGLACENNGKIVSSVNRMELNQTSSKEWHPNVAGIAIKNNGTIDGCKNQANLFAESTLAVAGLDDSGEEYSYSVILGGVSCENYGKVLSSENHGLVCGVGKISGIITGGVATINYGTIDFCKNFGEINSTSARSERGQDVNGSKYSYYMISGGVAGNNYNTISNSRSFGDIVAKGNVANIISGGLVAQNSSSGDLVGVVEKSLAKNHITAKSETGQVCVGGVVGVNSSSISSCGFVGDIDADTNSTEDEQIFSYKVETAVVVFAGGIVGVNQGSSVQSCYADANFVGTDAVGHAEEGETSTARKIYAGICANIGIYYRTDYIYGYTSALQSFSGNYYVAKNSLSHAFGTSAVVMFNQYLSGTLDEVTDTLLQEYFGSNQTAMIKVSALSDIPAEVVIDE